MKESDGGERAVWCVACQWEEEEQQVAYCSFISFEGRNNESENEPDKSRESRYDLWRGRTYG